MNAAAIAILAANLVILYFVFDIARLLRRILERMEGAAPIAKGAFWPTGEPRTSLWRGPPGQDSDITFSARHEFSILQTSIHGDSDSTCGTIRQSRPVSGKIRYFAIWRWCGDRWVVENGSVPPSCEPGPPPDFKGEFEGQFVKTEVVRGTR
jgi:hypothetical protein